MGYRIVDRVLRSLASVLFIIFLTAVPMPSRGASIPLQLHRALGVEGPDDVEPSGLTLCNGMLLTVSDDHDDTIFKVRIGPEAAYLEPYLKFSPPWQGWFDRLDFEGITCDAEGNLFLVSETRSRILQVTPDGARASWITPSLEPVGRQNGLFQVKNAYLEGISLVAPDRFVLSAERQPRGFVEVDRTTDPPGVKAYTADAGIFAFAENRSPDYSGLYTYRNRLYAIARNAFMVVKLVRRENRWVESEGWFYGHISQRPEYRYVSMRYGKAEGLCLDERYVYLILDNGGMARAQNPRDKRPLLLILHRPDAP